MAGATRTFSLLYPLLCTIIPLLWGRQSSFLAGAGATPDTGDAADATGADGAAAWGGGSLYPGQADVAQEEPTAVQRKVISPGTGGHGPPAEVVQQEPEAVQDGTILPGTQGRGPPAEAVQQEPEAVQDHIILPGTHGRGPPAEALQQEPEAVAQHIILPGTHGRGAPPRLMSGAGLVSVSTSAAGATHYVEAPGSTQIVFGWVPDLAAHSPGTRNLLELRRMLRDERLIETITVAGMEKRCTQRHLVNLRQLPHAFREALEEEKKARANPQRLSEIARSYEVRASTSNKQNTDVAGSYRQPDTSGDRADADVLAEFSILEQTSAVRADGPGGGNPGTAPLSDTGARDRGDGVRIPITTDYTPTPLPQPLGGEKRQSGADNPTEKRLLGTQLNLHLQCKLAALLGHPQLFLNPQHTELELLETIGEALGLSAQTEVGNMSAGRSTDLLGALEILRMASNPFTLGHIVLLAIAHLEARNFFGASPRKPFYSLGTLVSASVGNTAFYMLDEMCETDRGAAGAAKAWYQRGGSRRHPNPELSPLVQHLCNILEIILNGVHQAYTESLDELTKYNVIVEPLVDPGTNSARIQTRLCRGLSPVCDYEETTLFPSKPLSEHERRDSMQTKKAFTILTALGSGQVGPIEGDIIRPFKDAWSSQWSSLLADPTAHSDILEKSLWWDTREFIAAQKGYFFSALKPMQKGSGGILQDGEQALPDGEIRQRLDSYLKKLGARLERVRSTKKAAAGYMNAFNIAALLFLSGSQLCAHPGSFLFNLRRFVNEHFRRISTNKRIPVSQRSLMAFARTGQLKVYYNWCNFDPLALNYLFLLRYALSGPDAAALQDKQHTAVARTKTSLKLLQSKWTPTILKSLIRGFNQKAMTLQAKDLLLRSLDPTVFSGILTAFEFVTHTQANLVVNQKSFMFHETSAGSAKTAGTEKSAYKLHSEGLAKHADSMIRKWAEYGIPGDLKRRLAKGEKLPAGTSFANIAIADLSQWDSQLSSKWAEAYNAYLRHPYGQAALRAKDPVALLVKDSRDRLQTASETTVFLGRIASPARRKGGIAKVARALKSFFMSLLREHEMSEYAVWVGVKVDMKQVIQMCRAINNIAEVVKNERMYNFITDGWIAIVEDVVRMYTDVAARVPDYDFFSASSAEGRGSKLDAAIQRNTGFLNLHSRYAYLSEEDKKKEFQASMCADHCEALWNLIMGFVMPNLQNPGKLHGYEKDFASAREVERLNDPQYVNAFRFSLGIQVDFFDNMIDKKSKKSILQMKYGAALWFANAMKLAGQVNTAMANTNLGTALSMQAPYYGNYISDWIRQRKEARKKAIIGMLTLGLMGMYTLLSVADITQHMQDVGAGPPVQCVENLLLGPGCAPQAIAQATTNAVKVATQSVFKVGLFASITPYLMLPMAIISVWNILKSEIKILLQFEMAVKNMFGRLGRWFARPFKNWWNKRKKLKDSLFKRASDTFNKTKQETKKEPEPRDVHDPSNWGQSDLDSLGLPPERAVQEFEVTYTMPAFPMSAPLICPSS